MIPFADMLTPTLRSDLLIFISIAFWIYIPVCFFGVGSYALKQFRAGQLINTKCAPLSFAIPGQIGWLFVACVLTLIFFQSGYYVFVVLAGLAGLVLENGRTVQEQFGLTRLPPVRALSWSLVIFGAVMLIEVPLSGVSISLLKAIHLPDQEQEAVETFRHIDKPSVIFAFIFQVVFVFPMIEELFFRGFLLTFFKRYTSTWMALVLSAGIFAFAHANLAAALPLWFLGLVLGIAYEHTGSLLVPIGIHACWNLVTALSILLDKANP